MNDDSFKPQKLRAYPIMIMGKMALGRDERGNTHYLNFGARYIEAECLLMVEGTIGGFLGEQTLVLQRASIHEVPEEARKHYIALLKQAHLWLESKNYTVEESFQDHLTEMGVS